MLDGPRTCSLSIFLVRLSSSCCSWRYSSTSHRAWDAACPGHDVSIRVHGPGDSLGGIYPQKLSRRGITPANSPMPRVTPQQELALGQLPTMVSLIRRVR